MDSSIGIVAIITGITGLSIAIFTHVKHSECFKRCFSFDTRSIPSTPVHKKTNEKQPENEIETDV